MRSSLLVATSIFLAGCATAPGTPARGFEELGAGPAFKLGGLTVLVAAPAEVEWACRELGAKPPPGRRVLGCYSAIHQTLVTSENFWILLHEFKHVLEPTWRHE